MNSRPFHLPPLACVLPSLLGLALLAALAGGCDEIREKDMFYQAKKEPYEKSTFFENQMSARPLPPGTVARHDLNGAQYFKNALPGPDLSEKAEGEGFPAEFPTAGPELASRILRGQERYNIYCAPCHGYGGHGDGMIVQRGFTKPPSFVLLAEDESLDPQRYARERYLQTAPPGHYYHAITNGFGAMYSYASRVKPEDRWAIIAYIKALQATNPQPATPPPAMEIEPRQTRHRGD